MREITRTHNVEMSIEEMMFSAPSVFATQPISEVTERYGFVSTLNVINGLKEHGWMPVDATQKNVRIKSNQEFTKHLVRFRRLEDDIMVGDSALELLLTNSHDRSSGFVLHAGVFRMACANGIVIADSTFQKISTRHSKHAVERVIEGSYEVVDKVPMIAGELKQMMSQELSYASRLDIAERSVDLVLPEDTDDSKIINRGQIIDQMLRPMRMGDRGNDLWTTFNIVQEKVLRGGIRVVKHDLEKNRIKRNTTREVRNITRSIKLNKQLWEIAQDYKEAA